MSSRSDFEFGLNCCAVAIEVQAVKIEALLRLKRLLHHRAAIAARLLLRSLRPDRRVRDDQQSGAADEPDSSQVGCSSEFDHCFALRIGDRRIALTQRRYPAARRRWTC